jgi:leader peptidase (prepilin peptidase) / N-methyltransferase
MNGLFVGFWAAVGLVAGATLSPAASWLAGTVQHRRHTLTITGATTTTFLLIATQHAPWSELLALSVFAAITVELVAIDMLARQLPRTLIWPTCMAVAGLLAIETIRSGDMSGLLRAAASATALASGYLALAVISHGGLGAGDVRLAVLIGGVLGWHNWQALIVGAALGFVITGVAACALAIRRRCPAALPHGPGMLAGALLALLL